MEDGVTKRKSSLENPKTEVLWSYPRKSDKHILEIDG